MTFYEEIDIDKERGAGDLLGKDARDHGVGGDVAMTHNCLDVDRWSGEIPERRRRERGLGIDVTTFVPSATIEPPLQPTSSGRNHLRHAPSLPGGIAAMST